MPETKERIIRPTFIMRCEDCTSNARLPIQIDDSIMPCVVECPKCRHRQEWKSVPILPKLPPTADLPNYRVYEGITLNEINSILLKQEQEKESKQEAREDTPKISEVTTPQTNSNPLPFATLADGLGTLVKDLFQQSEFMQSEIEKFKNQIGGFFKSQWKYAEQFRSQWIEMYLQEFMNFPFVGIPIDCDDQLASKYARLILTPKFFDTGLGIKAAGRGGFRLELMNQYTRMNLDFPVEIAQELEIPPSLDLRVLGNKILGGSVQFCWKDIPGTVEDHDSSESLRSICFSNPAVARLWLAKHGVRPFAPNPVLENNLNFRQVDDTIIHSPSYLPAWKLFVKTGRIGIFWEAAMAARRFAVLVGLALIGTTPVFVVGDHERAAWTGLYTNFGMEGSTVMANKLVYFKNGDHVVWDSVLKSKSVIVDLHCSHEGESGKEIDVTVLEKLMSYEGRVVLIGPDPFLDFNRENDRAALVHALAPWQIYEPAEWENWSGKKLRIPGLHEMLRKS